MQSDNLFSLKQNMRMHSKKVYSNILCYKKFPMLWEKLHFDRVLSVLIFVGMIVGGGSYVRGI